MKKNIILFSFVLFSFLIIGIDKVNAACTTHTNYYFYSLTDWYTAFDGKEFPYKQVNTASFSDELPVGAVPESAKYNWIDFSAEEDGWTFRRFWEIKKDVANDIDVIKNGDEWYFVHTATWIHDNTGEVNEDNLDTSKFKIEDMVRNSYYAVAEDGTMALRIQDTPNNIITGTVVRTIEETWKDFAEAARAQTASDGSHPTDKYVWVPALLQVKFNVCDEVVEPEPTEEYDVIVKYVDDDTNSDVDDTSYLGSFATGDRYSTTCPKTIGEYELVSSENLSGIMSSSDVTLYCRYSKPEPDPEPEPEPAVEYSVVVKYVNDETDEEIKTSSNIGKFKEGENYSATCMDTIDNYTLVSNKELSGTMQNQDVVLYCRYSPPKTDPTPTDKHSVIVKYVDDETDEEIEQPTNVGKFSKGEQYSTTCYETINGYQLVSQKNFTATMEDKDVVLYCRYKLPSPDPTYSLTVNFLGKTTREPLRDPIVQKNTYKTGDKYKATCLDSIGSTYILDSYTGNLSGTFANNDITINCLYTTQAIQTSDIPIYAIIIIGLGALIYSGLYIKNKKLS